MADFAAEMIGGNFNVMSTDVFFSVAGATHGQRRTAVLASVLPMFTLSAFLAQCFRVGTRSYATVIGKGDSGRTLTAPFGVSIACLPLGRMASRPGAEPWMCCTVVTPQAIISKAEYSVSR